MSAPRHLSVPEFTARIAREMCAIAQTLPFRLDRGVDAERVFWADIGGNERIGIGWVAEGDNGPYWMIAIANADRRKVSRARIREVVRLVTGRQSPFELAPPFSAAPHMTMVRVPA